MELQLTNAQAEALDAAKFVSAVSDQVRLRKVSHFLTLRAFIARTNVDPTDEMVVELTPSALSYFSQIRS